jgi:mannose-1-phosphate guanylyltransferase/MurNAc alpha-1-phosphate uridylyltransferase
VTGSTTSSVIGAGAIVAGDVTRCVVLPGATVAAGESLVDTIRLGTAVTVKVSL